MRAIVVDPSCSVLLVRFEFEHWIGWATPGGGVDPGETDEEAIRRELAEEVGLEGFELGPLVWTRTHVLELADWDGQVEHYYFVRARKFDPVPRLTWAQLNAEHVTVARWWTLAELEAADANFAPRRLPNLVRELLVNGPPEVPTDVGV